MRLSKESLDFESPKVQKTIKKYGGLTYNCYRELNKSFGIKKLDIANHFDISVYTLEKFISAHKNVINRKKEKQ